ncbi:MAG: hypothetical protein MJB57_12595 [Gemmatimonadetes bacterium]|nr:hypothetical protein [Gemmatimonadota bacterium]
MRLVSSSKGRLLVALGFVALGTGLAVAPWLLGWEWSVGGFLTDLGSELLGLALTVSILDYFFEQRRLRAEGRRLAWDTFHQIERAVWVWQGGPLRLETDELLGLLRGDEALHELTPSTQGMLLGLGIRGRELLKGKREAVAAVSGLSDALAELSGLARFGESGGISLSAARDAVAASARALAEILDLAAPPLSARLIRGRDGSIEAQKRRYGLRLGDGA